jgi:outer membrane protein assembly factor BamA
MDTMKAYGRQGYLDARLRPTPEYDDSSQKVTYKIEVREGSQYRMGTLSFKGLLERDAKALRQAWRLPRGEVFDEGYPSEEFFKRDIGGSLQSLAEERRAQGLPPPRIGVNRQVNKELLTVDITLELVTGKPPPQ